MYVRAKFSSSILGRALLMPKMEKIKKSRKLFRDVEVNTRKIS